MFPLAYLGDLFPTHFLLDICKLSKVCSIWTNIPKIIDYPNFYSDFVHFFEEDETKSKIPSQIKPPLIIHDYMCIICFIIFFKLDQRCLGRQGRRNQSGAGGHHPLRFWQE